MFNIVVVKSRRKSISLSVAQDEVVTLRVPYGVGESEIQRIIQEKTEWMQRQLARIKVSSQPKKQFVAGEIFSFLGQNHTIVISDDYFRTLRQTDTEFMVSKFFIHKLKSLLQQWYKTRAALLIPERVTACNAPNLFTYRTIRITSAKTRWGSCSRTGTISFSWRLIQLPLWVVDYVVVHELVHTKFHNHGPLFWKQVQSLYPRFAQARTELKAFTHTW